ncbi:hypothetical protein SAMN05216259_102392 [Actinacidiphila guanduensis]|uniref:MmyB-like transcription regulator ligand binding domain-containing protein n=2 Tax=Actinacidiphila guanduensis TaxID=310781 RepID=A0A1G9Y336_9ACTN|nr:hypothetical protein SAMN05216259_102392 [Actinacidiphila guanduensis]
MARLVFLDSHVRALYADWPSKARAVVGNLRLVAGRHPEDTALHALVGELSAKSGEFAAMWADHRITACTVAPYEMRHPLVGALIVTQQSLSHGPGPVVVAAATAPGSPARAALTLLAQLTARTGDFTEPVRTRSRVGQDRPARDVTPRTRHRTTAAPLTAGRPHAATPLACPPSNPHVSA